MVELFERVFAYGRKNDATCHYLRQYSAHRICDDFSLEGVTFVENAWTQSRLVCVQEVYYLLHRTKRPRDIYANFLLWQQ